MRSVLAAMVLFAAGVVVPTFAASAAPDSAGSEHWLMFTQNISGENLSLFITGETQAAGQVSGPGVGSPIPFTVQPGSVTTVSIPQTAEVSSSDLVEQKGIHVTADREVTVYGLNQGTATTDAYLGLPVDILGKNYVVLDASNTIVHNSDAAEFGIVGTQNNTIVLITPSDGVDGHVAKVRYSITLNAGDTYQLMDLGDGTATLTGTTIEASAPVAVFGGNRCTNIPGDQNVVACDHVVEQLFPESSWGSDFVTEALATRTGGDTFRFVAGTDDTEVFIDGASLGSFDRGEYFERNLIGPHVWQATQPILLAQYSNSSSFDGVTSDPFMMLAPPFEQFLSRYTVSTPASGISQNFINVVAHTSSIGHITLDGTPIPAGSFAPIGSSGFSGAKIAVELGSHSIEGPDAFGVFSYGFDSYDSYGYPGGLSLAAIALDSDSDGLPDQWETDGLDYDHDGVVDVDLPAMGADPNVKDIFVEVDWMQKDGHCIWFSCWGSRNFAPMQAALDDVVKAFADAPGGPIRLHIDAGPNSTMDPAHKTKWGNRSRANRVPYNEVLGTQTNGEYDWSAFDVIRQSNFEAARNEVFHYVVYGDRFQGTPSPQCPDGKCFSGISRSIPGGNLLVTDGPWSAGFTRTNERGTFMHELGHNLNLYHGGGPTGTYQWDPVYKSIMNYSYQLNGLSPNAGLDYSRGTPYDDWANVRFDGGLVGALGDIVPPPITSVDDEVSFNEFQARGVLARPGDGAVTLVGPTFVLADTGSRTLLFDVTNPSNVSATYTLALTTTFPVGVIPSVTVAPGSTARLAVPVDTNGLLPGTYDAAVELRSDVGGDGLSFVQASVVVPNAADPAFAGQLADIGNEVAAASTTDIDDSLRAVVLAQLSAAQEAAPIASDDSYLAQSAQVLRVAAPGVLANDTLNGGSLGSGTVSATTGGSAVLSPNGGFEYTPPSLATVSSDSFSYSVTNGAGTSTANVTVSINRPPTTGADSASSVAGQAAVQIPVLANDSDPDGDPLTLSAVQVLSGAGSAAVSGTSVVFTPPASVGAVSTTVLQYTVSDGRGGVSTGQAGVVVSPPTQSDPTLVVRTAVITTVPKTTILAGVAPIASKPKPTCTVVGVTIGDVQSSFKTFPVLSACVGTTAAGSFIYVPKTGSFGFVGGPRATPSLSGTTADVKIVVTIGGSRSSALIRLKRSGPTKAPIYTLK